MINDQKINSSDNEDDDIDTGVIDDIDDEKSEPNNNKNLFFTQVDKFPSSNEEIMTKMAISGLIGKLSVKWSLLRINMHDSNM